MEFKRNSELSNLKKDGYHVLKSVFNQAQIELARNQVLKNLKLFKNTRTTISSRHLAGFHRYPQLDSLHSMLTSKEEIYKHISNELGGMEVVTIGLSDITINRSQEWHCDLLRGAFSSYLDEDICWGANGGGVYKALLYLQQGKSLAVVPGSHTKKVSLADDAAAVPNDMQSISYIPVNPGDVVIMDIRLIHRGSHEVETELLKLDETAKILISTVFAGIGCPLTSAMEEGNFFRLKAWDAKYNN